MDIVGILGGSGSGIDIGHHGNGRLEVDWWRACIFGERDHPEAQPFCICDRRQWYGQDR